MNSLEVNNRTDFESHSDLLCIVSNNFLHRII